MQVVHFYHCYAAGQWRSPLAEHLAALEDAGFDGRFIVGLVGSVWQRAEARAELDAIRPPDRIVEADSGWEQVTLHAVHAHARSEDGAVLYAHSKGAGNPNEFQDAWRRSMTHHVVSGWRHCAEQIESGACDMVGCHWLTAARFPGAIVDPIFGGNFWLASCAYLRTLERCAENTRHDAEAWVGLQSADAAHGGAGRALDLAPGWPGWDCFARPRVRRLVASPA